MNPKNSICRCLVLLLFFSLISPLCASSCSLLFVHLGKSIPSCIFTTMKQARYLNPDCDIYLLSDEESYPEFQRGHLEFFNEEKIHLVDMNHIRMSDQHRAFHEVNKIDPFLVEGYWMYASKRFFILYDFIQAKNLINVVHLESDSMLYIELDELLPLFQSISLAAPFQSLKGCIPCFVFIKDRESLTLLVEHILLEMKNFKGNKPHICVNDMQTLASFYVKFGADSFLPLPTLMPEYSRYYPKKRSSFAMDNATSLNFLSLYSSLFPQYIFDAAGLAIFINGNDRKYSPNHGSGTIHSRCLFNPSFFSFFWGKDQKGRDVPFFSFKEKSYRIINLHFHSKMPEEYASFANPLGEFPKRKRS